MRLVKVKKKIFKREFLGMRVVTVVFDVYEMNHDSEETEISVNRVFYVFPSVKGMEAEEPLQ